MTFLGRGVNPFNQALIGGGNGGFNPITEFGANLKYMGFAGPNSTQPLTGNNPPQVSIFSPNSTNGAVNYWTDFSKEGQATTPIYQSDFTTSVDGFIPTNCTLTFNESAGGESGWLKLAATAGTGSKWATRVIFTPGFVYRMKYRAFIPSTNTFCDNILVIGQAGDWYYNVLRENFPVNSIFEGGYTYLKSNNSSVRVQMFDNTNGNFEGTGEEVFIKDVIVEQLPGAAFGSVTLGSAPICSNSTRPTFIGGEIQTNGTANVISDDKVFPGLINGDLSGTWYFKINDLEGAGVTSLFKADASAVLNPQSRVTFYFDTGNRLVMNWQNNGTAQTRVFPVTVTRGTVSEVIVKSNGASYEAYQDGVSLGVPTNNNGNWYGDLNGANPLTISSFGRRHSITAVYDAWGYQYTAYVGGIVTTPEQDAEMTTYLNAQLV